MVLAAAAVRCGHPERRDVTRAWGQRVDAVEAPLEAGIRRVDAFAAHGDFPAATAAAREAALAARRARDAVQAMAPPPGRPSSQREELVFLNHAALALERFAAGDGRVDAQEELRSILRRGRAHQRGARGAER